MLDMLPLKCNVSMTLHTESATMDRFRRSTQLRSFVRKSQLEL